jgi:hypothetical protein
MLSIELLGGITVALNPWSSPMDPRCFHPDDILWVHAWALIAPGGWSVSLCVSDDGDEYLALRPPGADKAVFLMDPDGCQTTLWQPEWPGAVERFESPRDAALRLCPLTPLLARLHEMAMLLLQEANTGNWPLWSEIASSAVHRCP